MFYGVKADAGVEEHPSVTESKIRDVIKSNLQISRDVPIIKVRRTPNGPTVRGSKPITVCFEKWGDKDEILRKANLVMNLVMSAKQGALNAELIWGNTTLQQAIG